MWYIFDITLRNTKGQTPPKGGGRKATGPMRYKFFAERYAIVVTARCAVTTRVPQRVAGLPKDAIQAIFFV